MRLMSPRDLVPNRKKKKPRWRYLVYAAGAIFFLFVFLFVYYRMAEAPYKMANSSMAPTIKKGDLFWLNWTANPDLERNALVQYKGLYPGTSDYSYIGRVKGIPGDRIDLIAGRYEINGRELVSPGGIPYVGERTFELVIPEGKYFILADNPHKGYDSRSIGLIPAESIEAEVVPADE